MTRLRDWPSRFAALVAGARARPFAWGSHDCCLWAADAVQALTGRDPAAQWRGTYSSELGAFRIVFTLGGLPAIAALGGVEIPPGLSVTGDVGTVRWPDGIVSLGVCGGDGRWLVVGDAGLVTLRDCALRAWGVGCV
jgi:hypothetical protein